MNLIAEKNVSRRRFIEQTALGLCALAVGQFAGPMLLPANAQAQIQSAVAQNIADHFSRVRTMMGEFVQFGPRGEQTGGKFYIERPGKVHFSYDAPAHFKVTADGRNVLLENTRLKTYDAYPLSQTPLKLLLDDRIDLSGGKVQNVREEADLTTIQLADRTAFGNSTITMMFDPASFELRQWTITDGQGKDTTVMIFNVQEGVRFDPSVFSINYQKIDASRQDQNR